MMEPREIDKLKEVYAARAYDTDLSYCDVDPVYLQRVQQVERLILRSLRLAGIHKQMANLKVVDYGCGNGRWLARWLAWGASPTNLIGLDLRETAIDLARASLPAVSFRQLDGRPAPLEAGRFDVVYQNLVFSSILADHDRRTVARDMTRLVRPGGLILWYDFTVNNPRNPDVRGVSRGAMKRLFPGYETLFERRVTLAPPVARRVAPKSMFASDLLETLFPIARTHLFTALRQKTT